MKELDRLALIESPDITQSQKEALAFDKSFRVKKQCLLKAIKEGWDFPESLIEKGMVDESAKIQALWVNLYKGSMGSYKEIALNPLTKIALVIAIVRLDHIKWTQEEQSYFLRHSNQELNYKILARKDLDPFLEDVALFLNHENKSLKKVSVERYDQLESKYSAKKLKESFTFSQEKKSAKAL